MNCISDYRLDPLGKDPGHMTLQWQSAKVISALQCVVNESHYWYFKYLS